MTNKAGNINAKIGYNIKTDVKLKTEKRNSNKFSFNIGKWNNIFPSISSKDLRTSMRFESAVVDASN